MATVPEAQKQQMKYMSYMMPIMMIFMSINLPASVALYWFVGGIFSIIQQVITVYIIRPMLRKRVEEEYQKNPPKISKNTTQRKDVTETNTKQKNISHQKASKKS